MLQLCPQPDSTRFTADGTNQAARAAGFTLVEMLVVIALMLVLAGLAVLVIPAATDGQATVSAASQLQQWIEIAKQRAARDRVPRGIRLLPGTAPLKFTMPASNASGTAVFVTNLEYLEQPDFYDLGTSTTNFWTGTKNLTKSFGLTAPTVAQVTTVPSGAASPPTITQVVFQVPTGTTPAFTNPVKSLTGGLTNTAANQPLFPVQVGDYLELNGVSYVISQVAPTKIGAKAVTPAMQPFTLTISTATMPPPTPPGASATQSSPTINISNFRIIRQPRPIGDDPMEMPQNIAIDLTPRFINSTAPTPGPWDLPAPSLTAPLDIIFSPDGKVMTTPSPIFNSATFDKIILWVRDVTIPDGQGDPTLVVIYPRTGLVASYPVDLGNLTTFPYTFTITGKKS